ncbi:hypothetical protein ACOSP7_004169 [Xanthoceras sorbifolium]
MEDFSLKFLFSAWALFQFLVPSSAQTCKSSVFLNQYIYRSCNDLESLNSFLHWNYNQTTGTVDITYRHTRIQPRRWVAWGVNPTGKGMVGSQALVAYQNPAGILRVYTSPLTNYNTRLEEGVLSFEAAKISAEFTNNKEVIIYAKFVLPMNVTAVNHVWEDGPVNEDYSLGRHAMNADNLRSMGVVHGGINMFGWGILLPIGVLIARYSKDSAYWGLVLLGTVGAAIGFYLGAKSHGIQYDAHKYIGIILVILGFLQVLAVNNLRKHKGFFILKAKKIWMLTYIAFFIFIFIIFILSSNPIFRCKKVTSGASA